MPWRTVLIALAFCASIGTVCAQTNDNPPPETSVTGPGDLSEKLNKTNGVIRPKGNVDPGIRKLAPVPDPNTTPVIPPPGTPGGSPGPEPK
jgi:hypothetical protein